MTKSEAKFRCYVAIGWGLLTVFAMIGVMLGKDAGMMIGTIGAIMWAMTRMIREMIDSFKLLSIIDKVEVMTEPEQDKTDDSTK